MDATFFQKNRQNLLKELEPHSMAILFSGKAPNKSADEAYPFVANRHFYYLTGISEPNVIYVAVKDQSDVKEHLFIEKADPFMEKWVGKTISKDEAKTASGLDTIHDLDGFNKFIDQLLFQNAFEHLYLDLERRSLEGDETASTHFAKKITAAYPQLDIHNLYHQIAEQRIFKTEEEVEKIREAGHITSEGIKMVLSQAQPGMKEYQLEAYFNFVLKTYGVKDFAFNTICASGHNATVLHYVENEDTAEDGELVLLDLGAKHDLYSADISFTFPVNGTFSDRQKLFYNIVLKTLHETTAMIKPGLKFAELNEQTKKMLADECIKVGLIENAEEITNYYYHGVSHFLGLDTHDVGSYKDRVLEPGMVLTVEPGLYIAEEGIGIRIEDDVLVTDDGYEVLTDDLPRTVEEIEAFMAANKLEV